MQVKNNKFILLLTVLMVVASLAIAADSSNVKSLFDRYQAVHRQYQEAVSAGANETKINNLAQQLNQARIDYYKSIGVDVEDSFKPASNTESKSIESDFSNDNYTQNRAGTQKSVTKRRSPLEREFAEILADLARPDAEKHLKEIKKRLENLINRCTDSELKRDAIFKLADLIFDDTGKLGESQKVLLKFAREVPDKEIRRQAFARIRMLKKKAVVKQLRNEYLEIQSAATEKWGSFSKSAWLAIPVKLWKLVSYQTTNIRRRIKAKALQKALKEYDSALLATYPLGSTDELTRSQLIPFNRVRLLVNGRTSFHYRMEYAKRAQSSLYVQTLLFQDDETGNKLTDIMCEKARNGVDVRLILDDFFSSGKKDGVIQRLKNAGVKVLINNPILKNLIKANFRSHQKLFIIDETIAIVGGMNIGSEYAKGELEEYGWRDTDVEVRGPVIVEILDLFNRNWEELTLKQSHAKGDYEKYKKAKTEITEFKGLKNVEKLIRGPIPVYFETPPVFEDVDARFVTATPIDEKDDNILDLFEIYLARAKKEVIFESAYFIPTDRLKHAIRIAVARGVGVKIITNSIESNNHPSGGWAGRRSYEEVLQSGARIFEWRGAQTLHSKVSLFDDFAVTLGAYNVNSRSHSCDSEDVIAFEDRRVAKAFRKVLMKDLARCKEITLSEVQSWNKEFLKKMQMEFFNLFKFMF
jgi:cardiolipin synthase